MNTATEKEIESLRNLKTKALKARYRELFEEESPSSNRMHLFRRIAWRLQAAAEGELSERVAIGFQFFGHARLGDRKRHR
jgi:Protein of unknown function (DUF2924)